MSNSKPENGYWLTRFCFQRALGFIYTIGFLIIIRQYVPLLGENGLYPVSNFLEVVSFWQAPSLFWIDASDRTLLILGWSGLTLAILALTGLSDAYGVWFSAAVWAVLWIFYQSFVNVGQTFYGFGWESILLETGFLAIFMGSSDTRPPPLVIWMLRWVLFRIMFGAGMIKLRADSCWRDLTCMDYHYETQPIPNPLSWYFHKMPAAWHKGGVLYTHFVELIVPWAYFIPRHAGYAAGIVTILFQGILILSGNLSWLNYITIVISMACFDDRFLARMMRLRIPEFRPDSWRRRGVLIALSVLIVILSIPPALNLFSKRQLMNASFTPLHLVNTYGAFGSVTRTRNEVIIEGTDSPVLGPAAVWKEYEFKCKPGNVARAPCLMSPYHWRLDWQIWFAAMNTFTNHPWFLNLVAKLLQNDGPVLSLLDHNPFPDTPPEFIRAELYEYHFTTAEERRSTGHWWKRTFVRSYLPPLSLDMPKFKEVLRRQKWIA
ncbi:MAG: lipase maturation factor family protein [Candidatus Omnitrophota bacterium]|nr:lipase maturation factor family protein [Candidatus Omnitrophota bacterium]